MCVGVCACVFVCVEGGAGELTLYTILQSLTLGSSVMRTCLGTPCMQCDKQRSKYCRLPVRKTNE